MKPAARTLAPYLRLPMPALLVCATATLLLAACGGGGDAGSPPPTVSTSIATPVRYGEVMTITLVGTNLDQALTLTSSGCRNFVRGAGSTATTVTYTCTVSGATGAQSVTVTGGGITAASVPFTTPVPQVSMLLSNGAGVAGTVVLTLNPDAAPITVDNFLAYVRAGFYNGTIFHRYLPGFVLQGGGFEGPMTVGLNSLNNPKPTGAAIVLEDNTNLSNLLYTVAMARTNAPDSATSQFFVNLGDNTNLDREGNRRGYAVFATVTAGRDVIDAVAGAPSTSWGTIFGDGSRLPVPNVTIAAATQTR
jgi:cyclophilin family peptidyl-prolyl cis-trans isomerase